MDRGGFVCLVRLVSRKLEITSLNSQFWLLGPWYQMLGRVKTGVSVD